LTIFWFLSGIWQRLIINQLTFWSMLTLKNQVGGCGLRMRQILLTLRKWVELMMRVTWSSVKNMWLMVLPTSWPNAFCRTRKLWFVCSYNMHFYFFSFASINIIFPCYNCRIFHRRNCRKVSFLSYFLYLNGFSFTFPSPKL